MYVRLKTKRFISLSDIGSRSARSRLSAVPVRRWARVCHRLVSCQCPSSRSVQVSKSRDRPWPWPWASACLSDALQSTWMVGGWWLVVHVTSPWGLKWNLESGIWWFEVEGAPLKAVGTCWCPARYRSTLHREWIHACARLVVAPSPPGKTPGSRGTNLPCRPTRPTRPDQTNPHAASMLALCRLAQQLADATSRAQSYSTCVVIY